MNVGIIVDATCDLPTSIFDRHKVHILPTLVSIKNTLLADQRDPDTSLRFYHETTAGQLATANYESSTEESLRTALHDADLLYHFDSLLIIAPHLKLSQSLQNLREAILNLQPSFQKFRSQASLTNPFKIRVIESNSGYSGYGLVLYEALRLMNEKARTVDQIKKPLSDFKSRIETLVLPGHTNFNYHLLSEPPFNLSWVSLQKLKLLKTVPVFKVDQEGIKKASSLSSLNAENDFFERVYDQVTRTNLSNHLVNISYAGKLAQLRVLPSFNALHEHVKSKGGKLVNSVMSPTSAVQLGKGAISISFAGS